MGFGEMIPAFVQYVPNQYARAAVVLIVSFLVFRLILAVFNRVFVKLTSKTKTDIDDLLIAKSSKPLSMIALFLSLRLALAELVLSESFAGNSALLIYSALVIAVGYLIYAFVDIALVAGWKKLAEKSKVKMNESITNLVHGVMKIFLIILAVLYILDLWGVEIVPLLGALGIAGLAVALALQPVLANIFSGVSVIMDKSVKVGDVVNLEDGTGGVIYKIGIRATRIRTWDNELVIIPNTKLANSNIKNVTLPEPRGRAVVKFGVAYGSSIEKVKKVVIQAVKDLPHALKDPAPDVKFLEMADSSLNFKAYIHVDSYKNRYGVFEAATTAIYNALNKAKIEIPFPQRDVHMNKE